MKFRKTISDFGDEWQKFDNNKVSTKELRKIFNSYFLIFPKKFFNNKTVGIDLGSGSGRWAEFIISKVSRCFESSFDLQQRFLRVASSLPVKNAICAHLSFSP